ncbi:MAG: cupin domain-containing protein [Polyangiaceae bacterium]
MKPVINLDQLDLEACNEGPFRQSYGIISDRIGARKLGYNLTIVPPGAKACPKHNHHANEEMFFVLSGTGLLRFGDDEYPLRANDVIACPPGKRLVAHQIVNTGDTDLRYLAISTKERVDIVEYPDSNKVGAFVGDYAAMDLSAMFKADSTVGYNEGE